LVLGGAGNAEGSGVLYWQEAAAAGDLPSAVSAAAVAPVLRSVFLQEDVDCQALKWLALWAATQHQHRTYRGVEVQLQKHMCPVHSNQWYVTKTRHAELWSITKAKITSKCMIKCQHITHSRANKLSSARKLFSISLICVS
jgi:hypothetical protein